MAAKIGSSAIDCSLHPYSMCMWTNSDHPSGGRIISPFAEIVLVDMGKEVMPNQ